MGLSQYDETIAVNTAYEYFAADGTGGVFLVNTFRFAIRIDSITAVNNDVVDHHVRLLVLPDQWTGGDLGVVLVPAGAGYTSGPPVDLLLALCPANPWIVLERRDNLTFALQEVVTLTNKVTVFARGGQL